MAGAPPKPPRLPHFADEDAFADFLLARLAKGFGPAFVALLTEAYREFEPNLAKYVLDSETGNGCGYRALAQVASQQGVAVYLGMVRLGPTRPVRWRSDCTEILHPRGQDFLGLAEEHVADLCARRPALQHRHRLEWPG
ncbi:Ces2c [Symbiodinium pilosum]|uniref:Ces2c protein n=1 Tax=Symbiodinium pilosum TaxID=2952 RepID=A0A812S468_SYMPI|nr:Ces2c [Symbiodinium pilosum]